MFERSIRQAVEIVYEDDSLLVVNKPREIHSVRQQADDAVTLADLVAAYLPNAGNNGRNPLKAAKFSAWIFYKWLGNGRKIY